MFGTCILRLTSTKPGCYGCEINLKSTRTLSRAGGMAKFTRGDALRFIRKIHRNLDQGELAGQARRLWLEVKSKENLDQPPTEESLRMAISRAEKSNKQLAMLTKRFVCEVLRIDQYFIEHHYPGEKELLDELTAWEAKKRRDEIFGTAVAEPVGSASKLKRPPIDIEELAKSTDDMYFTQRGPVARALDEHVIAYGETVVLHVHGTTGSGKSTFLHHWFHSNKGSLHNRPVLAINLENKTGDYINQRIEKYLARFSSEAFENVLDGIMTFERPVIVLDSIESFDLGSAVGSTHSQQIAISDLIRNATRPDRTASIILVSASDKASGAQELIDDLKVAAGPSWHEVKFEGLAMRDALSFLADKKLSRSEEELRSVVEFLGSNAALINAYATVKDEDSFSLLDRSSAERMRSDDRVKDRVEDLASIFDILRKEQPYDYVVFVILACSHEGMIVDDIGTIYQTLLECGWPWTDEIAISASEGREIQRTVLKRCSEGELSHFVRSSASSTFVRRVPDGVAKQKHGMHRNLHYLAREAIQISFGKHLTFTAIAFVHYMGAILIAGRTPSGREQGYKPYVTDIEHFHALIFHLVSMFDLLRRADPGSFSFQPGASLEVLNAKARDQKLAAQLTLGSLSFESAKRFPKEFLDSLYGDIMRKTLSREEYSTSRQLGHYERKLVMLSLFLVDRDHSSSKDLEVREGLSEPNKKAILLDIVVCANHCGKLSIAHDAARSLARMLGESRHFLRDFRSVVDIMAFGKDSEVRDRNILLNEYSNLMVAISTTYFREGEVRTAFEILDQQIGGALDEIGRTGLSSIAASDLARQRRSNMSGILVSYRRIIAKYGQVCSALGRVAEAEAAYAVAEALEQQRLPGDVAHRGESGRNYVRMLATYRRDREDTEEKIRSVVDANIQFSTKKNRYHEIIEWYVERSWLALATNRAAEIKESLESITKLTNDHSLNVSYVALREIELLSLILDHKANDRINKKSIDALVQTLRRSGHKLLLLEALRYRRSIDPREAETSELQKEIDELIERTAIDIRWLRM